MQLNSKLQKQQGATDAKRDNVDISNLMQSIEQTESVNTETEKLPSYIDRLSALAKNFEEIANSFDEIASKPISLGIKQESIDEFRSEKNRYIEEEKEVLATHRTKMLKMLEEHEKKTRNIIRKGEGIWLSDFWMKILVGSVYSLIGLLVLALWLK